MRGAIAKFRGRIGCVAFKKIGEVSMLRYLMSALVFVIMSCYEPMPTTTAQTEESLDAAWVAGDELFFNWLVLRYIYLGNDRLNDFAYYNNKQSVIDRISTQDHSLVAAMFKELNSHPLADGHTYYVDPKYGQIFWKSLTSSVTNYGDLGMLVRTTGLGSVDTIQVHRVVPNGPAYKAGIRPGDRVLKMGSISLVGDNADALIQAFSANALLQVNEVVELQVQRLDSSFTSQVSAAIVRYPTVWADSLAGLGIIDIDGFISDEQNNQHSSQEFLEALTILKNYDTLVVDVRGNPGGFVNEAIQMLSAITKEKDVLFRIVRRVEPDLLDTQIVYSETKQPRTLNKIFFVLVDGYSASAAEMLAACFKNNLDAVLYGTSSYGKGVGQSSIETPHGGYAMVTSFENFDGSWNGWHKIGIEPHVLVANQDALDYLVAQLRPSLSKTSAWDWQANSAVPAVPTPNAKPAYQVPAWYKPQMPGSYWGEITLPSK
jgi:carboxyl-terminal processing protease